jgi:hypothetical protein
MMHGQKTITLNNKLSSWYLVSEPIFDKTGSYVACNIRCVHETVVAVQK